jgi:hypothetical protein
MKALNNERMKIIYALATVLLALTLCRAQTINDPKPTDDAYTREVVRLLTALQKNGWSGWNTGTVVVRRYLGNDDPTVKTFAYVQPDLVFQILEANKRVAVTQVVKGKPYREESPIKEETATDTPPIWAEKVTAATLEVDGFSLACVLREWPALIVNDGPSSPPQKEWRLANHPTLILRNEYGRTTWEVASVRVLKKIGGREFSCVKTIHKTTIYVDGLMEVITTQYLSPDVPGHLVEELKEFYKVKKEGKEPVPHMITHQQVVELKLP